MARPDKLPDEAYLDPDLKQKHYERVASEVSERLEIPLSFDRRRRYPFIERPH